MRQLSNRLKFLNNGSTVEMHFRVWDEVWRFVIQI
jgi:hypothetical protein